MNSGTKSGFGSAPMVVESGTYFPTFNLNANASLAELQANPGLTETVPFTYMRVGNIVTVSGTVRITTIAGASTNTSVSATLPLRITKKATGGTFFGQAFVSGVGATTSGVVMAVVSGDGSSTTSKGLANMVFPAPLVGVLVFKVSFSYPLFDQKAFL